MIIVAFAFNHLYWDKSISEEKLINNHWMTVSDEGIRIFDFKEDGDCLVKSLKENSGSFSIITEEGEWKIDDDRLRIECDDIYYKGETSIKSESFTIEAGHVFKKSEWHMDSVIRNLLEGTEWKRGNGNFIFEDTGRYWNFGIGIIEDNSGIWSIENHELVLDPDRGDNFRADIFIKLSREDRGIPSFKDDGVMMLKYKPSDSIIFKIDD